MDAPVYQSGTAYVAPISAPFRQLTVESVSLAEIMTAPDAWAVVLKHAPALGLTVKSPQVQPYLSNMTVDSFVKFGVLTQAAVNTINVELSALPRTAWPIQ